MKLKYFILLAAFAISSCDFIDIDPPKNQLLTANVFGTDETATAAMVDIYIGMIGRNSDSYYIPYACGHAADELARYSTNVPLSDLYINRPKPADAFTNRFWNNSYFYIYQANSVIEGCENSANLHPEVKKQLLAEAHFIRAFWVYYLTSFFGEIPLTITSNYSVNLNLRRSPITDVFRQIVSDLEYAIGNLNPLYVNGTSRATVNDRCRPNQSAAMALLARVQVANKKWEEAERLTSSVIDNVALYDTVPINQVFLSNNKESLWQVAQPVPRSTNISTYEGYGFVLETKPNVTAGFVSSAVSKNLLEAFEQGDLRRKHWIGEFVDMKVIPNQSYFFPSKYKVRVTTATPTEQSTILRLAEQFLIRAEARVQLGNFDGALADINVIRKRAGLPFLPPGDKQYLLKAILKERQTELFAEWGHRWIDLKRMGFAEEIMPTVLAGKQGGAWSSTMELWPLPQIEVERNGNLVPNPGYN